MTTATRVTVDVSFMLKLVLVEPYAAEARLRLRSWIAAGTVRLAPHSMLLR